MKIFKKVSRFGKKIMAGRNVTKVKFTTEEWDTQFTKGKWEFLLEAQYNVTTISAILHDLAKQQKPITVLDIGCGNGALARLLNPELVTYTGTDISQVALDQAATVAPQGTYKQASMDADPELDTTYDVLIFSEVLLYGDYEKTLGIHRKYLKPGGYVIISLYRTWRTRLIWWVIRRQVDVIESLSISHHTRRISWDICLGKLRNQTTDKS